MFKLKPFLLFIIFTCGFSNSWAANRIFSANVSQESLRTLKRMEYKESIPNGLLHSISLVETNIGQTGKYLPWPYTIRLNRYKSEVFTDIDKAYDLLDKLVDLGYQNFDLIVNDENYYSLSYSGVEDALNNYIQSEEIIISARSTIKYLKDKTAAEKMLNRLVENQWFNIKIGIMQLSYDVAKLNSENIIDTLNAYENIAIMVNQLKKIRKQNTWWESVGLYHSKKSVKAKRYVKNVWAMYQRVHKIKVR